MLSYRKRQLLSLSESQNHRCAYCALPMTILFYEENSQRVFSTATLEHIVPLSRGGAESDWNYVAACYLCNVIKNDYNNGLVFAELIAQLFQNSELRAKWHTLTETEFNLVRRFVKTELCKRDKDYAFHNVGRRNH